MAARFQDVLNCDAAISAKAACLAQLPLGAWKMLANDRRGESAFTACFGG